MTFSAATSLATLNNPVLVGLSGASAFVGLPALEKTIVEGGVSFLAIKILNLLLYAVNFYAVQQPGRLDGRRQSESTELTTTTNDEKKSKKKKKQQQQQQQQLEEDDDKNIFQNLRDRSLVFPSGWAFAIWGLIFLGELLSCTSSLLFVRESSQIASVIRKASAGFMMGQVFQTLWTASFRPKYKGNAMYISAAMLSGIAVSMSRAHAAFSLNSSSYNLLSYLLYFFPFTLHFGWTTAAALVNLNGNIAMMKNVSPQLVAWAGHLSAIAATALGVSITLARKAPVFGGVIAWALSACSTGMQARLNKVKDNENNNNNNAAVSGSEKKRTGIYGVRVQKWLCAVGAIVSAVASVAVAVAPKN